MQRQTGPVNKWIKRINIKDKSIIINFQAKISGRVRKEIGKIKKRKK